MLEFSEIDLDRPSGYQRQLVNEALRTIFRRTQSMDRFLDENLDLRFNELAGGVGPYPDQLHEMIFELVARGKLRTLIESVGQTKEYRDSTALKDMVDTWRLKDLDRGGRGTKRAASTAPDRVPKGLERALGLAARRSATASLEHLAQLSRSVCMLVSGRNGATGCLIAPDLVLTNAYVIHGSETKDIRAQFDPASDLEATDIRVAEVVLSDPTDIAGAVEGDFLTSLDFAVVRLKHKVPAKRVPYTLDKSRQRLTVGEEVLMFHHAALRPLSTSLGEIVGGTSESDRLHHSCDSLRGSGGAPVFDTQLRLIGLHEAGGPEHNIAIRADRIAAALDVAKVG